MAQGPEMNATNKGVAIAGGRVIRGTQDGFLYALDAKTGAAAVGAAGRRLEHRRRRSARRPSCGTTSSTSRKAGGDWGIRGRMMAFKVEDGSLAWSFDLIPTGRRDRRGYLGDTPTPRTTAAAPPG